ncbi:MULTISPECIES: phage tail protein [Edwardsiella]|uniref:Phage tail protein n=2 Tax=Edwardsiella anguillarum TaxID=1821960 RepID=A0ABY8SCL9_9GAMM|nr:MULTISPECIES: phage tail protein [Edwardsiella]AIJ06496.1 putative phage gene [Edwardsiella anguillarum ET080813]AKR78054.1 phage tail protein [Edwardsiella sp. LADL05-105]KAB0593153.1 phage tail protein [Edwardsiella anguillarum]WHP82428.1 phage tail protein [Edwardsiella anguillarum]WHP86227.1 phage tail protein [Edwardsiella anguillarum]
MTQLAELTTYIQEQIPRRANITFSSEMDDITLFPAVKNLGNGCLRIQVRQYDAVLTWDAWPYRLASPDLLFSVIESWLTYHANGLRDELGLAIPRTDVSVDDQGNAWLQIIIPMADPLTLREDETGEILRNGKRYCLDSPDIWVAEHYTIHPGAADDQG